MATRNLTLKVAIGGRKYRATYQDGPALVDAALQYLAASCVRESDAIASPDEMGKIARLKLGGRKQEVFAVFFLDNRHRLIEYREMFTGSISGASVYPREVVRAVLETNAAAVILAHNHPSGVCKPSRADIAITKRLEDALRLIDARVLDHFVVSPKDAVSMTAQGLL